MTKLRGTDPAREAMRAVIAQWAEVIGDERVTTSDVIGRATEMTGSQFGDDTLAYPEFRNALLAASAEKAEHSMPERSGNHKLNR